MPQRYTQHHHIALKKAIEAKLGWGQSEHWSTKDFQQLSDHIKAETGILLSISTLKRFFGTVKSDTNPSASTLDTLCEFMGYQNWRVFTENQYQLNVAADRRTIPLLSSLMNAHTGFIPYGKVLWLLLIFVGLALISGFFVQSDTSARQFPKDIPFNIKQVSKGLPNTVIFQYDLDGIDCKRVEIQQYWDESKRFEVDKNAKEAAILYHYPGYYRAKLVLDGQIVEERDLYIASDGWLGTIEYPGQPRYLLDSDMAASETLSASASILKNLEEKDTFNWMSFYYLKDFENLAGADFELQTAFKNTMRHGNNPCQKTKLRLVGTEGAVSIHFSIPGCVANNIIYLNGRMVRGGDSDLSMLGCDYTEFVPIEVKKTGKQLQLIRTGEVVFSDTLSYDLGQIAGLSFHFMGAGAVDYVDIKSGESQLIYDNFSDNILE